MKLSLIGRFILRGNTVMSIRRDKEQVQQLKSELRAAKQGYTSRVRASDLRLVKLALVMVILAIIAALVHGRIHI